MKIQQIRNATVKIEYSGTTFLVDPWLLKKGEFGTFRNTPFRPLTEDREDIPMPMVELPMPKEELLKGIDAYILTHFHPDHIDWNKEGILGDSLNKHIPTFVENPEDAKKLWDEGFTDLEVLYQNSSIKDIELIKTPCRHGTKVPCGPACGVIFRSPNEKTLYLVGDTIWYEPIKNIIDEYNPDIVILYACGASLKFFGRLIMDQHDVLKVHEAAPNAMLVISHMESVAHATVTRAEMRNYIIKHGFEKNAIIPADGETINF